MSMLFVKYLHVTCAVLSVSGYFLRGIWMIKNSLMLQRRWVRTVPHVVDTLLLIAGIWLAIMIHQYPFVNSWLTAKALALIAYIVLGTIGIKRGERMRVRIAAWAAALATFAYIAGVAVTRSPTLALF